MNSENPLDEWMFQPESPYEEYWNVKIKLIAAYMDRFPDGEREARWKEWEEVECIPAMAAHGFTAAQVEEFNAFEVWQAANASRQEKDPLLCLWDEWVKEGKPRA